MRSPLIQRQTIKYKENESFSLHKVIKSGVNNTYQKTSHWHEDLEIIYTIRGNLSLYIDGEYLNVGAGHLAVVNCESIHRAVIETNDLGDPSAIAVIDLLIPKNFLDAQFSEYKTICFTNDVTKASEELADLMMKIGEYDSSSSRPHDRLYMHGLLLQLLYHLYEKGVRPKENDYCVNESVIKLKKILNYIDEHYFEPITQADIAARFYFTPQYFSRYFKLCTGMTFSEHLTGRRIHNARRELIQTDKLVTQIAFDNGFSDERSFINSFKKLYNITPLQYRKQIIENHG